MSEDLNKDNTIDLTDQNNYNNESTNYNEEYQNISSESDSSNHNDSNISNNDINSKIQNGWLQLSSIFNNTINIVKDKSIEVYNSETIQHLRQNASEKWEYTTEAATPIWQKTKATVSTAVEITKDKVAIVAEKIKPTIETVGEKVSVGAQVGWKNVVSVAEYTSNEFAKLTSHNNEAVNDNSSNPPANYETKSSDYPYTGL